jgi:5-hydroxyisourate hydrolase-like protein (transthyretin family)
MARLRGKLINSADSNKNMKKILITIIGLLCAASLVVNAQDAKPAKKQFTPEQKAVQKELLEKYDTNKNGKLDKAEKAKMTTEDKARYKKAFAAKKAPSAKTAKKAKTAFAATPAPAAAPAPETAPAAAPTAPAASAAPATPAQ